MKIQILLRSGGTVTLQPPEVFNFHSFVTEIIRDQRLRLHGLFIPYDNIAAVMQGDLATQFTMPEPAGRPN